MNTRKVMTCIKVMNRIIVIAWLIFTLSAIPAYTAHIEAESKTVPVSKAQLSFAPLVKKTAPAVVNIYTSKKVRYDLAPFNDPFFRYFFGHIPNERVEKSLGSGVIIRANGLIATNYHLINNSDQIIVVLADKRELSAKIVISDPKADLALLKVEPEHSLPYLSLGNSDQLEVGDLVIAIGNPFGIGQTVTHGIISALDRTAGDSGIYQFFIQTDAAINPGNSGGALVNMDGQLIGINTAIYSKSGGSQGIGFATPSNILAAIISNTEQGNVSRGQVLRPWLGVNTSTVTSTITEALGLQPLTGVIVKQVYTNSPAEKFGIQVGDIITKIDNHLIEDDKSLHARIGTYSSGQVINLAIIRNGNPISKTVKLTVPDAKSADTSIKKLQGNHPLAGVQVMDLTPYIKDEMGLAANESGVVITDIDPSSNARELGIQTDDILLAINNDKILNTEQLQKLLQKRTNRWAIILKRNDEILRLFVSKQ